MKTEMLRWERPIRGALLLALALPCFALTGCRTTAAERQEIRQETRIETRTEDRMERRREAVRDEIRD